MDETAEKHTLQSNFAMEQKVAKCEFRRRNVLGQNGILSNHVNNKNCITMEYTLLDDTSSLVYLPRSMRHSSQSVLKTFRKRSERCENENFASLQSNISPGKLSMQMMMCFPLLIH